MQLKKVVRGTFFAALAALAMGTRSAAFADPTVTLSKWVDDIKISGDYRLRQEYFDKKTQTQLDRSRSRFRLRLNADWKLPNKFTVKTTLASGVGEQVSTNQSFDSLGTQKQIWIDKAYVLYQPWDWIKLQGGKMENPIWRQYSSDVVWDNDFNPEGWSESVDTLVGPVRVFATGLQMVADEDSGSNGGFGHQNDQWMIGEQAGLEVRLPFESRLKGAAANYYWKYSQLSDYGQTVSATTPWIPSPNVNEGNRRIGTSLANNFNVWEYTGELSSWVFSLPLSLQGTSIVNVGARDTLPTAAGAVKQKLNHGYQMGAILGKAKEKNSWEVAYFNKFSQTDATVADVSDSDFGDGGTNRKGHIYWIAFAPQEYMVLTLKQSQTDVITKSLAPSIAGQGDRIIRTQFDVSWKF